MEATFKHIYVHKEKPSVDRSVLKNAYIVYKRIPYKKSHSALGCCQKNTTDAARDTMDLNILIIELLPFTF